MIGDIVVKCSNRDTGLFVAIGVGAESRQHGWLGAKRTALIAIVGEDSGSTDRVYFADLDLIDLTFSKHGDPNYIDSLIVEDGNGLNLHVHGADLANNGIEQFVFADGSIAEEIVIGDTQKTGFVGTVNNDVIDFGGYVGVGFEAAQSSAGDDAYKCPQSIVDT